MEERFQEPRMRGDQNNEWREIRVPQTRMAMLPAGSSARSLISHAGTGPRSYRRSDERMFVELCEQLSDDPHIDASQVEVDIRDSEVVLRGHVDSREVKRRVEDIAYQIRGVTQVQNMLRISGRDLTTNVTETFR